MDSLVREPRRTKVRPKTTESTIRHFPFGAQNPPTPNRFLVRLGIAFDRTFIERYHGKCETGRHDLGVVGMHASGISQMLLFWFAKSPGGVYAKTERLSVK